MGLKKKIAARKHATPLGAKPPLSLNPRNAPAVEVTLVHPVLVLVLPSPQMHVQQATPVTISIS